MTSKFSRRPRIQPTPPVCRERPGYIPDGGEPVSAVPDGRRLIYPTRGLPVGSGGPQGCWPALSVPQRITVRIYTRLLSPPAPPHIEGSGLFVCTRVGALLQWEGSYASNADGYSGQITYLPGTLELTGLFSWRHDAGVWGDWGGRAAPVYLTEPTIAEWTSVTTPDPEARCSGSFTF